VTGTGPGTWSGTRSGSRRELRRCWGEATVERTLSAKLMKEDPRSGKWTGVWSLEQGARCQVPVAGRIPGGASGIIGQVKCLLVYCVRGRERGRGRGRDSDDGDAPRMDPQLWECGLHWSGSIGNNKTDARGWDGIGLSIQPWDGAGLVEGYAEINVQQEKSRQGRTGHTQGGLMCWLDVGCLMLTVVAGSWERGEELGGEAGSSWSSWTAPAGRELLLAWRPEQEGGEGRNQVPTCNF